MGIYRSKKDTTVYVEGIKYDSTKTAVKDIQTMVGSISGVKVRAAGGRVYIQTRTGTIIIAKGYYAVKDAVSNIFSSSSRDFLSIYESSTGAVATSGDSTSTDVVPTLVSISGSPAATQITRWSSASAITGDGNLTFDGSTLAVTGTVTWTSGGSANANTAYTHSQDNTQAHSDYLINTGNDSTAGSITATAFLVGTDEVFHKGDEDWQTSSTTTPTMAIATSRNMELLPSTNATTLAFSNAHNGMTGVVIIDSSIDGTLTLPATSHPTTIPYASSYRVVASFVLYGSEYVWQYSSFPNAPV